MRPLRGCAARLSHVSQLPSPKLPPEVLVDLPSDLLRRRPDIRAAERQLAAATVQVGGIFFPKFSLTGSYGVQSFCASDWCTRCRRLCPSDRRLAGPFLTPGEVAPTLLDAVASNRCAVEMAKELYVRGLSDFLNVLETER